MKKDCDEKDRITTLVHMSAGFRQRMIEEIREELRRMSDKEFLKHRKSLRALSRAGPVGADS
jgi:hypothetical protein